MHVLSPTLFHLYISTPSKHTQVAQLITHADDIIIIATHGNIRLQRHIYNHIYTTSTLGLVKSYNLTLNSDKTICILSTPDPATIQDLINNTILDMHTYPNILGLTLDPKLIDNTTLYNYSKSSLRPSGANTK